VGKLGVVGWIDLMSTESVMNRPRLESRSTYRQISYKVNECNLENPCATESIYRLCIAIWRISMNPVVLIIIVTTISVTICDLRNVMATENECLYMAPS